MNLDLSNLEHRGWLEVPNISNEKELFSIVNLLGQVIPHPNGNVMDTVTPKDKSLGLRGSFSSKFGLSSFPLHTDTAFWPCPARYVLMKVESASDCETRILSFETLFNQMSSNAKIAAEEAVFLLKTPRKSFYTSVFFKVNGLSAFKYDPCCMTPANKQAKFFQAELLELVNIFEFQSVKWNGNNAIVIDNWKVMHGRAAVSDSDLNRKLLRIYIGKK